MLGWEWVVLPLVGSVIGWLTNFLAIRMLFRPKEPVRLFGRWTFQGVLPRRREDLARVVADTVENELLPMDELLEKIDVAGYEAEVVNTVVGYVDRRLDENLPGSLPEQFRRMVVGYIRRVVQREASAVVRDVSGNLTKRIRDEFSVGNLVKEKMERLDTDQLEGLVQRVARQELRVIEVLGAVLGGAIGLFQAVLFRLI